MALPAYPLPVVTDPVYEIIVKGTLSDGGGGAKKAYSVFYYRRVAGSVGVNKASLMTIFSSTVIAPLLLATHSRYAPNAANVRNIQDVGDVPSTITIAGVGALATDSLPSDDAVVVLMLSATRGKMCRGRKHFAGGVEASTTLDLLNAGGVTLWQDVRDACWAQLVDSDGNTWNPFILSRTWSRLTTPVSIFGANVVDARLLKTIGTMRKRRTPTVYA